MSMGSLLWAGGGGGSVLCPASVRTTGIVTTFPALSPVNAPSVALAFVMNQPIASITPSILLYRADGTLISASSVTLNATANYSMGGGAFAPVLAEALSIWTSGGTIRWQFDNSTAAAITVSYALAVALFDFNLGATTQSQLFTATSGGFGSANSLPSHTIASQFPYFFANARQSDAYYHIGVIALTSGKTSAYTEAPTSQTTVIHPTMRDLATVKFGNLQSSLFWFDADAPGEWDTPGSFSSGSSYQLDNVPDAETFSQGFKIASTVAIPRATSGWIAVIG